MRLYWEDPYQTRFTARVTQAWSEGATHYAVLDQTLFYPTSGGQPHDTGVLGGVRVTKVLEREKGGEILHVLEAPLEAGQVVEGEIHWNRRYRHMQRHTAQHILSQAFVRAAGWPTVSVSLARPTCVIDLEADPDEGVIRKAEALANWAVYANLPIRAFFASEAEAAQLPLRRAPKVTGRIRVVEIEGWDLAACGGTHLRSSAEAGPIKILKYEKHRRGTTRVYFTAGWEALEDYAAKHTALKTVAEHFSAQPLEVPARVAKLEALLQEVRGALQETQRLLAERIVRELLETHPDRTIAALVPAVVLDEVGARLAEWPGVLALLVAPEGERARVLLTQHPERGADLRALWNAALRPLGAKGGGREVLLGALPAARAAAALEAFRKAVR
ncbi:alanyl-tRNA editing protein [Marinithermus hydrothermalis]|uniref:Threonyl/alanyl tRNA synthetase SAD n=1 Tax=Marinithermus hydrothermalis (strain DSM 14884 / JCM 11576 / T1) TaxID=869210 RepID=F2NN25_MARHT|nr:alanyl-tRNA editing protein [Marinithermus hydrothermalis]AEB12764.1 Threonyl/alanyl tRNA synthetase SAD [Marinithermus hydrothermalis DSM 14884]